MNMIQKRKNELNKILANRDKRIYACENNIWLFSLYYFTKFHHFVMPQFHMDMYNDLLFNGHVHLIWEMFRESAKTSLTKIKIIHSIVYRKKRFITWTSFDQKKAEANLFDIVIELQTNQRLIADFGQLFYDDNKSQKSSEKKSIGEFITANKIKSKAYSTGQAIRGEVYQEFRPDLSVLDDIETSKTMVSDAKTTQVIEYIDELIAGLSGDANIIVLANRLTDTGSIAYLKDKVKGNYRWKHRSVAVMENGRIVWPNKYVLTTEEAENKNVNIKDSKKHVVSLQAKKEDLGETIYNREMMNMPLSDDNREFHWAWLQERFKIEDADSRNCNRYVCIDVADSKEREERRSRGVPDYTGIIVVDWDIENNWYVRYAKRKRLNAPELIDEIFYIWKAFNPIKIGIEKKAFEDQVRPYILERSNEEDIYPVVEELKHGGRAKEDRIRGSLQGRCQARKIKFLERPFDNTEDLIMELYDFPRAKFDDLSDGLAYIEQIGSRPMVSGDSRIMKEEHQEMMDMRRPQNTTRNLINNL